MASSPMEGRLSRSKYMSDGTTSPEPRLRSRAPEPSRTVTTVFEVPKSMPYIAFPFRPGPAAPGGKRT